jgi:hypothetical protein
MTTVTLLRPIQAHGEERRVIELREPNGADIKACGGYPGAGLATDQGNLLTIRADVVGAYIARLGAIPPSSVDQLSPVDWIRCQNAVTSFFNEPEESPETEQTTSSDVISTSPGFGNGEIPTPSLR